MNILKKLAVGLLGLIVVLAVVGLFLPSTARVEREVVIEAPQSTVFALVNGYKRFNDWSPWARYDPNTEYTYLGPDQGVGARMEWQSDNPDVGIGSQEVTASEPLSRVETALDFGPQGSADAYFDLTPEGDGTRVVWGFEAPFGMNLIARYFGLTMDWVLGPHYEEGLDNLKQLAESLPPADWAGLDVGIVEVEPVPIAYVSTSSALEPEAISEAHAEAYGAIGQFLAGQSIEAQGAPLTIDTNWTADTYEFDAALPLAAVPEVEVAEDSSVRLASTYGGRVLRVVHQGPYTGLEAVHDQVEAYVAAHGLETTERSWSEWVSDPGSTAESDLITHLYFPIL